MNSIVSDGAELVIKKPIGQIAGEGQQIVETQETLRDCVTKSMTNYLTQLGQEDPTNVYNLVLSEVEAPLLEAIMRYTRGNQTRAALVLGLNRGTLRKKLKTYGLLS